MGDMGGKIALIALALIMLAGVISSSINAKKEQKKDSDAEK